MRLRALLLLLVCGIRCRAWDTPPHQAITKAALDALPKAYVSRLAPETGALIEIYCIYPDRYGEMESYGFVRRSPGPRDAQEIRRYCVRPDGQAIHGATGDREMDTGSLVYLLERIFSNLAENRTGEAAQYAGVLSHFIADSLSPPHAIGAEQLLAMASGAGLGERINFHAAIERSIPEFTLNGRVPRNLAAHLVPAAEAIVEQCYAGAAENKRELPRMVKAVAAHDEPGLNQYRLRAGIRAAEILSDAVYTVLTLSEPGH